MIDTPFKIGPIGSTDREVPVLEQVSHTKRCQSNPPLTDLPLEHVIL
jgi:hypothetical protein